MVGLYLKLNAWRTRGEETNREFHAWLSPLLDSAAAKTPDEIRSRFAQLPFAMEWAL
jgi:hypothetical protein